MSDATRDSVTIHNFRLDSNFTHVINSTWADPNLSFKAKGILIYILTRPPNWVVYPWQLAKLYQGEAKGNGIEAVRVAMIELKQMGYLIYSKRKNSKGHWEHRYDAFPAPYEKIKKIIPHTDFPDLDFPDTENANVIISNDITSNDLNKNTYPSGKAVGSPPSSKIKTPTKKNLSDPQLIVRKDHKIPELSIKISDEKHKELCEKLGNSIVEECYTSLQNWKISKWEAGNKKDVKAHSDYGRIIDWVIEKVKNSRSNKTNISNKDLILSKFKNFEIYNGATCYISDESIAFERGMTHMSLRFKDYGFKDQLDNILRRFKISI